jgi:hypothetical protein
MVGGRSVPFSVPKQLTKLMHCVEWGSAHTALPQTGACVENTYLEGGGEPLESRWRAVREPSESR